ncbi:MAG: hypothetical protein JHC95_04060 [Solirubrobacteraceae bacterium]|nr:hypothetical protein [Solirubrobacteraceae bacterium]
MQLPLIDALRARAKSEGGFTMVLVMLSLVVILSASAAAVSATSGDVKSGGDDVQRKQAFAAAEAGVQAYAYYLTLNPEYWQGCTNSTTQQLNQAVAQGATRTWTTLPDSPAQYAIELLPANGATSCNSSSPDATFINQTTGSFRIRVTGRASSSSTVKRSLVATFRVPGFTNFVYFTDSEDNGNIQFASTDQINGPLHSNDTLLICPPAKFGRGPSDTIETAKPGVGNSGTGWTTASGCSGTPKWNEPGTSTFSDAGTFLKNADDMQMPSTNSDLYSQTLTNYRFKRKTQITLTGSTMTVTGMRQDGTSLNNVSMALPSNGLVYVSNDTSGCSAHSLSGGYPSNPYSSARNGCGEAWVSGTYSSNLTIGAQGDVVVKEDITRTGDGMLGLIANDWVRIYHPCGSGPSPAPSPTSGDLGDVTVDAAILAINQRFTVDKYACGAKQGNLNINGAIAQQVRGAVGTGGGSGTGYIKNYVYDDRMRFRSPPKFLSPANSSWRIVAQQEQVPAQ